MERVETDTHNVNVTEEVEVKAKVPGVGDLAKDMIRNSATNEQVLAAVKEKFPEAKTSMASINWYRNKLRGDGEDVPTARELKAETKAEDKAAKEAAKAEAKAKKAAEREEAKAAKAAEKAEAKRVADEEKARVKAEKDAEKAAAKAAKEAAKAEKAAEGAETSADEAPDFLQ